MRSPLSEQQPLVVQCYEQLQQQIINGQLTPGQKLKIDELSQLLGVGHSPVREALSRMVASGLVVAQANRGFRVAQVSEHEVRDLYRTLLQIDLLALRQALQLGDAAWEGKVVAALHQLSLVETKDSDVSYADWSARNLAFHTALISGCGSPCLLEIRHNLYLRFDRYCRTAFRLGQQTLALNHEEHRQLALAALARDFERTRELLTHHMLGAEEDVITVLRLHGML